MRFDDQGHIIWTSPRELYQMVVDNPRRLLTGYLMAGTPKAFPDCASYCDFLEAIWERTSVHPRNLYLRGSCHIGFSIAPRNEKVWIAMTDQSDLDLVIVDADYFHRFEAELRRWEQRNPVKSPTDKGAKAAARREQDRQCNCCRDEPLPSTVCIHHKKTMGRVAALAHCGRVRGLNAFLYPDWHSAQERYEFDLRKLRQGVEEGWLTPPPKHSLPSGPPGQAAPNVEQPAVPPE
jgi:hypothetical protein